MKLSPIALGLAVLFLAFTGSVSAGSRPLHTGFLDDVYLRSDSTSADKWLSKARGAGASFVRINTYWNSIAPADRPLGFEPANPADQAYRWTALDQAVRSAASNRLEPILSAMYAPPWAEGPERDPNARPGTWKPDPNEFALFGKALAKRYDGTFSDPLQPGRVLPRVSYFQAWNEPNHYFFFTPQAKKNGKIVSTGLYRQLLNRFYSAVKSVRGRAMVLAAGLAPIGRPGYAVIAPLSFIRELTCIRVNGRPQRSCSGALRADIWDVHPYTTGGPMRSALGRDDVSLGDLPKLKSTLRNAERHGKLRGVYQRTKIWVTEFSWDTKSPDPGGLPMKLARRWIPEALYRMWSNGISLVSWLRIVDDPAPYGSLGWGDLIHSGFYFYTNDDDPDGAKAKGTLSSFRFPFVAFKTHTGFKFWGRTSDGKGGPVRIQQKRGGVWRQMKLSRADRHGIFNGAIRTRHKSGIVRAIHRSQKSVPFSLKRVRDKRFRPFGGT